MKKTYKSTDCGQTSWQGGYSIQIPDRVIIARVTDKRKVIAIETRKNTRWSRGKGRFPVPLQRLRNVGRLHGRGGGYSIQIPDRVIIARVTDKRKVIAIEKRTNTGWSRGKGRFPVPLQRLRIVGRLHGRGALASKFQTGSS